jgi:hypothetical protein
VNTIIVSQGSLTALTMLPSVVQGDPNLGRSVVRKSSSKPVDGVKFNDSASALHTMKRGHSDPMPIRMQERPRGLRHYPPKHSQVFQWKPLVKKIEYKHPPPRTSSVKTVTPPCSGKNWDEIPQGKKCVAPPRRNNRKQHYDMLDEVGRRRRIRDTDGTLQGRRQALEESFQETTGNKRKNYTLEMARNGIPCKSFGDKLFKNPLMVPGFFTKDNSWGIRFGHILRREPGERPGIIPGSNWGFSKATQSTWEDAKIFARDLKLLWRRNPTIPKIILLCCSEILETHADRKGLFDEEHFQLDPENKTVEQQGRMKMIKSIIKKCDRGMDHTIDWETVQDPLVYVGLLRAFFGKLKPPLMGAYNYDRFFEAARQETPLARISAARTVVMSLSTANQIVLAYMIKFLNRLLAPEHVAHNKLTAKDLASFFAPMFIRPFGWPVHEERLSNKAREGQNIMQVKVKKNEPISGQSLNIIVSLLGQGSNEIFQSISLRAYDKRQTKRISYEEKVAIKAENEARDSVFELKEWESASGCYTLDEDAPSQTAGGPTSPASD